MAHSKFKILRLQRLELAKAWTEVYTRLLTQAVEQPDILELEDYYRVLQYRQRRN
jgi:hypothetical protein